MNRGNPYRLCFDSTLRVGTIVIALVIVTVLVLKGGVTVSDAVGADEWPQWRGPDRDGKSTSEGLRRSWESSPPELLWMEEGFGSGYASVSIADGMIFSTGNKNNGQHVTALSLADGSMIWSTQVTEGVPEHGYTGSRSTPTYDSGRLYVVTSNGQIVCLDAADGDSIWSRDFRDWEGVMMSGWGFSESPLVDGDVVLCTPGAADAALVALNKLNGEEVWRAAVPDFGDGTNRPGERLRPGASYSSIVVSEAAGIKQYVQILGQGVVGIRAADGEFLWGFEDVANRVANIPTPIVVGDYVFCSTGYGTGSVLLEIQDGRRAVVAREIYFLDSRQLQNHHGGLILIDGYLYGGHGHNNGFPICVSMDDGEVAWGGDQRGPGTGSAAVTYADGLLVFRYQNGTVALIEAQPDGYDLKGWFDPEYQEGESWAHPVVVDGLLYLREQDKLMCYDLR